MNLFQVENNIKTAIGTLYPVYSEFDQNLLSSKEKDIIVTGIKELKTTDILQSPFWNARISVSVMCTMPSSGAEILNIAEKVTEKLLSMDINISDYTVNALFFDNRLQRLCYELLFTVKGFDTENFNCKKGDTSLVITDNLSVDISEYSFDRKRGFTEISASSGIISGDRGTLPLHLTIKGTIFCNNLRICELENLIVDKTPLTLTLDGCNLPSMYLSECTVSANIMDKKTEITLYMVSEKSTERVTAVE